MGGLIEADFAAAGKFDRGPNAPGLLFHLGAGDVLRLEESNLCLEVVAHEVKDGAEKVMPGVKLSGAGVSRVNGDLGRRQLEDQPAVTDVDEREAEDLAEEGAVGFGVVAVKQDVGAADHAGESNATGNGEAEKLGWRGSGAFSRVRARWRP